jgi:hypothetical protein
MGRVQPAVDDLAYLDGALTDEKTHRGRIRTISGIALDTQHARFFFIRPVAESP